MKTKLLILFVALVAATGGFFAGEYRAGKFWNTFFLDYVYNNESLEARLIVRELTCLREGKQFDGLKTLEMGLDRRLIELAIHAETVPRVALADYVIHAVREARTYRAQHPWTNSVPELSVEIEKLFQSVK